MVLCCLKQDQPSPSLPWSLLMLGSTLVRLLWTQHNMAAITEILLYKVGAYELCLHRLCTLMNLASAPPLNVQATQASASAPVEVSWSPPSGGAANITGYRIFYGGGESTYVDGVITSISLTLACLLYTSPSPRDATLSRMPSSA